MNSKRCVSCGRTFASNQPLKVSCCGQPIRIAGGSAKQGPTGRFRQHHRNLTEHCFRCEHWGPSEAGSCKAGCTLYKGTACQSVTAILNGADCFDEASPKFGSAKEGHWLVGPWISYEQLRKDVADFSSTIALMGFDAIAGVPRSGLMVASELAIRLGLPLYSFADGELLALSTGLRLRDQRPSAEKILVMEDSTASGRSIQEARQWVGDHPCVEYGAIYATSNGAKGVDHYHKILELPHWFEWNLLGNPSLAEEFVIGTDFDGILCPDFTEEEWDDGPRYRERMQTTPCIRHPGVARIRYIITARMEKYRALTEHWLSRNRVKYGQLIMGPWQSKAEQDQTDIGTWKAEQCRRLGIQIFVESEPLQAKRIAEIAAGVAAICPAVGMTYITKPEPQGLRFD